MSPAPEVVLPHAGDLDQQAARLVQAKQDLAEQQQVLRGTGAEAALVPALQEQLGQAREQIRELQGECAGLRAEVQAGGNQAGDRVIRLLASVEVLSLTACRSLCALAVSRAR